MDRLGISKGSRCFNGPITGDSIGLVPVRDSIYLYIVSIRTLLGALRLSRFGSPCNGRQRMPFRLLDDISFVFLFSDLRRLDYIRDCSQEVGNSKFLTRGGEDW